MVEGVPVMSLGISCLLLGTIGRVQCTRVSLRILELAHRRAHNEEFLVTRV